MDETQEAVIMSHTGTIIHATMSDLNGYFPATCSGSKERVKGWLERKDQK